MGIAHSYSYGNYAYIHGSIGICTKVCGKTWSVLVEVTHVHIHESYKTNLNIKVFG